MVWLDIGQPRGSFDSITLDPIIFPRVYDPSISACFVSSQPLAEERSLRGCDGFRDTLIQSAERRIEDLGLAVEFAFPVVFEVALEVAVAVAFEFVSVGTISNNRGPTI